MPLSQDFNNVSIGTAPELAAAVAAGNFKAVRRGLEFGIRPDARDAAGNTALLLAVQTGNLPMAGLLVGYGAGVEDAKLLAAALTHKSDDLTDFLLQSGADPLQHMNQSKRLLTRATVRGVDKAVGDLLAQGADPHITDDNGASLLILAAENGNRNVVEILLKAGLDVHQYDSKGRSPLRAAMQCRSLDCVNLLLAAGADPAARSEANRVMVSDHGFSMECLPEITAAVDAAYQKFHVNEAASMGDDRQVAALLAKGLPPDTFDRLGHTAMYYACFNKQPKIVRLLLDHGADPGLATKKGRSPLGASVERGDAESVEMLLAAGAKQTPVALHEACGRKYPEVVKALLKYGANPNMTARETKYLPEPPDFSIAQMLKVEPDDYPLHTAVKNNDLESVAALTAAGASTVAKNAASQTPLQLAQDAGNGALFKCVKSRHEEEMEQMGKSATTLGQQVGAMKTLRFKLPPGTPGSP